MSQTEFASRLGMKNAALSMVETGVNALTAKNVRLICAAFRVNEEWLLSGAGPMFADSSEEEEFIALYRRLSPETQAALLRLAQAAAPQEGADTYPPVSQNEDKYEKSADF